MSMRGLASIATGLISGDLSVGASRSGILTRSDDVIE
jgi:hypothetical protein